MSLCTCEKCGKSYSYASGECPQCRWPAVGYRVACRVCKGVLSYNRHADYYTSSSVVNGSTSTSTHRSHRACPHCGEPKPLLLVGDRTSELLTFLVGCAWFVPIVVLAVDLKPALRGWPELLAFGPDRVLGVAIAAYVGGSLLRWIASSVAWLRAPGTLVQGAAILLALLCVRQQGTGLAIVGAALVFALHRLGRRKAVAAYEREHLRPLTAEKGATR